MAMTFEDIMQSFPAASDYLSAIYLIDRDHGTVANSRLAAWLEVSRPAVSQAVSRLKKLDLITQERYSEIVLTEIGREFARKMLRRHYLLEHFLMNNLNMSWHEIDVEAKRLQNAISDNFEDKMFSSWGNPRPAPTATQFPVWTAKPISWLPLHWTMRKSARRFGLSASPKRERKPAGFWTSSTTKT
jgi:DtxR family Mn-dependent transcriptional regulator